MLEKVGFKNFLALRDVELTLEPFTVIVGPNASGKSSILEGIHRMCSLRSGQRRVLIEGGDFPEKFHNQPWINPSEILSKNEQVLNEYTFIEWRAFVKSESIKISLQAPLANVEETNQWSMNLQISLQTNHSFGYQNGDSDPFLYGESAEAIKEILPTSIKLHPSGQKMAFASYSPLKRPILESDGSGLATVCANIQQEQPEVFERIQKSLSAVIPRIKRFRLRRTDATRKNYVNREPKPDWTGIAEELLFDFIEGDAVSAKYVSEGTLLALCILTAAARFEGEALILIDDLERGLHPKAVHDLVRTLRELQKVNPKLQIIATSHSPFVLHELEPKEVRVTTFDPELGTLVAPLEAYPNFDQWRESMTPGEFWSFVGEDWVKDLFLEKARA